MLLTFSCYCEHVRLRQSPAALLLGERQTQEKAWNQFSRVHVLKGNCHHPCHSFLLVSSLSLSFHRCPVFRRLKEEAEKRKRPSWNELKGRKSDGESPGDAKHSATLSTRNPSRDQPEPGLINPAYEESEDGMRSFLPFITVSQSQ